jgi:tRNA threonylcarbamoyladenosine biosynthesis protein TsaE
MVMGKDLIIRSNNERETLNLGKQLGRFIDGTQVILLSGDLGAGKTLLVKGIAEGLQIDTSITSPTFNLVKEYRGDVNLFHMDLYRLDSIDDLYNIGFLDYFDRSGVVVIEWPELALGIIPKDYLHISFKVMDHEKRKLSLKVVGERANKLMKGLSQDANSGN